MDRLNRVLGVAPLSLCVWYMLLPLCIAAGRLAGYGFTLRGAPVWELLTAAMTLAAVGGLYAAKTPLNALNAVFAALLPLGAAMNGLCFIRLDKGPLSMALVLFTGMTALAGVKLARPAVLRWLSFFLSLAVLLFACAAAAAAALLDGFGEKRLVQALPSPGGRYVAEVIDHDQGALGGGTRVEVREAAVLDVGFGVYEREPACLYTGGWGAYRELHIEWKDDAVLLIDGAAYPLQKEG